jgi:transcriptional regulator with XRE-family HTH domain
VEGTVGADDFGKNLAELRRKQGWSQTKLGEKMGLTYHQILRYEKGTSVPSLEVVERFAEALGVKLSDLVSP